MTTHQNLLRLAGTGNPGRTFRATIATMKPIKFAMDESGDVYSVKELRRDGLGSGTPDEALYVLGEKIGRGHNCLPWMEIGPSKNAPKVIT